VTSPDRESWANPVKMQLSGEGIGSSSCLVTGVFAVSLPLLLPAPKSFVQITVQLIEADWSGEARTRMSIAAGNFASPVVAVSARFPEALFQDTMWKPVGAGTGWTGDPTEAEGTGDEGTGVEVKKPPPAPFPPTPPFAVGVVDVPAAVQATEQTEQTTSTAKGMNRFTSP
jgi:hypothetical protein